MTKISHEHKEQIETGTRNLLQAIGDNPNRDGLLETPERVFKAYSEIFAATGETQFNNYKLFPTDQETDMVIVADIPFYAMCEHHLVDFDSWNFFQ